MSTTLDTISHNALVLPPDQRIALAYQLLVSAEPNPDPDTEAAWEAEISRRINRFDASESQTTSATEVFALTGLR